MKYIQHTHRHRSGMTLVEVVVALMLASLTVAGIISGYFYSTKASVKAELAQAANAKAMERLEVARSAIWAPLRAEPVDQLVSSNFPDLLVSLDSASTNVAGTTATVRMTIAPISQTPPLRLVHVDCIWRFQGQQWVTNSVECIRAGGQ